MTMDFVASAIAVILLMPLAGCRGEPAAEETAPFDTVLVILGNEPLDDLTPTVDMIARVRKAVEFQKQHPATLLVFTGGPTTGTNSEAQMMADLAVEQGVATNRIRLEERARSTQENARLTASLIRGIRPRRILIVSKSDHLDWAMPIFRKEKVFRTAEPLPCKVTLAESVAQMKEYLARHPGNLRLRERLQALENGQKGTD